MDWFERRKLQYRRIISQLPHQQHPPTWRIRGTLILFQSNRKGYDKRYGEKARTEYDKDLAALVLADKPDLSKNLLHLFTHLQDVDFLPVVCAGWMAILGNTFLDPLAKANVSIINLHPALPVRCPPISFCDSLMVNLIRDNSMALEPLREHMKHGWRVELRRLES